MSIPDCADEWLFYIWAIGTDYDGCTTIDEYKHLIDELIEMSQKARECLRDGKIFSNLHEQPDFTNHTGGDYPN